MTFLKSLAFGLFFTLLLTNCQDNVNIGQPLLSFGFNNDIHNKGLAKVAVFGPQRVSYQYEEKDTCLDLSLNATSRRPLSVKFKDLFSLEDYNGFTIAVRVKKYADDDQKYTILSQEKLDSIGLNGWCLEAQSNGAWAWRLSDGISRWSYHPTKKQTLIDGMWHHLVFSYDSDQQEVRLYYDGKNVAVYSVSENQLKLDSIPISVGVSSISKNTSRDLFNGLVDDLAMWSRVLNANEIKALYREKGTKKISYPEVDEQFSVLTWNIEDGGINDGSYVGIQKVIDVLRGIKPDLILLQEANGAGATIADALGYTLYHRSESLNLLSSYPLGDSHNVYRAESIGCIELKLNEEESLLACPVLLSSFPQFDEYIESGVAVADSILIQEEQTRGKEIRFIMSELSQLSLRSNDTPIVLAGDLNCGSHLDWTEKNHVNYRNLTIEFPATKNLEEKGFKDSYRELYTDETKYLGQTWSLRDNTIIPNRIDYIFFKGKKLTPVSSYLINDHPLGFPSDHAALVTTFHWMSE